MNQWTFNVESYFFKKCCLFFLLVSVSLFFSCLCSKKQWQSFFLEWLGCHCFFGCKQLKKQWEQNFFRKSKKKHQKSIKDHPKNHIKWKKWENNVKFELNKWRTSGKKSMKKFFFACHCFFGYKQLKNSDT